MIFEKKYQIFLKSMTSLEYNCSGSLEQKNELFAIFRAVMVGTDDRKIVKNQSHLAKFGCVSGAILVILCKKIQYFFLQKIIKNTKQFLKKIDKKILPLVHKLWYMFWKEVWNIFNFFLQIPVNFQNSSGKRMTVTVTGTHRDSSQHILWPRKNWNEPSWQPFAHRRTHYLGVPKIWDKQKSTFLTHLFNFGHEGAPNVTKITYNMKIRWENSPRKKNWGSFVHRGLRYEFLRKKI